MENFPQDLVLLLSVDIVGSAEFKAKNSSFGKRSDWVIAFESFYCLLYTSPSPRDVEESRMPSSA